MNFKDLSHPDDTEKEFLLLKGISERKTDNYVIEKRLRKKDGEYLWFDVSITARRNSNGEVYKRRVYRVRLLS